nr:hypothetical protein Iba_chr14aCG14280 [Ipomoea batatas]
MASGKLEAWVDISIIHLTIRGEEKRHEDEEIGQNGGGQKRILLADDNRLQITVTISPLSLAQLKNC